MSAKTVMQFGEIQGDFLDAKHKNWVEIKSLDFSTSRNISQESGNPKRAVGTAAISKISITKHMDNSSPSIFLASISGQGQNCVIHLLKGGEALNTYMEYKLENAMISKYSVSDISGSGETMEHIEISFTTIKTVYTSYDAAGKIGTPMASGYDILGAKLI